MRIKVQRVSRKLDNITFCRPDPGYHADNAVDINPDDYEVMTELPDELPANDAVWPKGAPIANYYKFGNHIIRRSGRALNSSHIVDATRANT